MSFRLPHLNFRMSEKETFFLKSKSGWQPHPFFQDGDGSPCSHTVAAGNSYQTIPKLRLRLPLIIVS